MERHFKLSELSTTTQNVFEIPSAESAYCDVVDYTISHSCLAIKVSIPNKMYVLSFEAVDYFEIPLHWQGASFYIGSIEEYIELVNRVYNRGLSNDMGLSWNLVSPQFFKLDTEGFQIKIIASIVSLLDFDIWHKWLTNKRSGL